MIWILIWLQMETTNGVSYYHLGTYDSKEACVSELSTASVLVKGTSVIDCLEVDITTVRKK